MARRAPVDATPNVPPRSGLIQATDAPPNDPPEWEAGFAWLPEACGGSGVTDPCAPTERNASQTRGRLEYEPFLVWAGDACSSFGYSERDWLGRARRLLEAEESYQIARELWRGDQARAAGWPNLFLASSTADELTSSPQEPLVVLAMLEQGLGAVGHGRRGVIHATRDLVTHWANGGALRRESGRILTIHDTLVISDSGYDGSGPGAGEGDDPVDASPGSVWAYGTTQVIVRRGAIETLPDNLNEARTWAQATDREINDIEVLAQRAAAATWDGCVHVAAEADIDPPSVGGS